MTGFLATLAGVLVTGLLIWLGWINKKLSDLQSSVAVVVAQHQNNGGKTMKDALDRVDRTVAALDSKLDDHLVASAGDSALLAAHLKIKH